MQNERKNKGLMLADVIVSLALMATLLASVAAAMKASLSSYTANDEMAAVTQTARSIMAKMGKEIRTAEDVRTGSNTLTILPVLDGSGLTQIQYVFSNGSLNYVRTVNGIPTMYPLVASTDRVTLTSFTPTAVSGPYPADPTKSCTFTMTMKLTFQIGNQTFSVTGSACPRRNQLY